MKTLLNIVLYLLAHSILCLADMQTNYSRGVSEGDVCVGNGREMTFCAERRASGRIKRVLSFLPMFSRVVERLGGTLGFSLSWDRLSKKKTQKYKINKEIKSIYGFIFIFSINVRFIAELQLQHGSVTSEKSAVCKNPLHELSHNRSIPPDHTVQHGMVTNINPELSI